LEHRPVLAYYAETMVHDEEIQNMLNDLKAWAGEEHGRNAELARTFGVSKQLVSDWFSGHSTPTWATGLKIQAFLKKQRRRTRKRGVEK
jgi:hypothetical protein